MISALILSVVENPLNWLSRVIIPDDVEPCNPLGGDEHVLSLQLPSVRHIAFRTGMTLIGIVERNRPVTCPRFKLLQLPDLVIVELRRGYSPLGVSLYAYILRQS